MTSVELIGSRGPGGPVAMLQAHSKSCFGYRSWLVSNFFSDAIFQLHSNRSCAIIFMRVCYI